MVTQGTQGESYERELRAASTLAREAGAEILKFYDKPIRVEQKKSADSIEPVTEADRAANELIVHRLAREFPDDGILAEESIDTKARLQKRRVWIIDPLDGTTGFIDRNGDFAVQIGLAVEGESRLGVVYQPLADTLFWAARGSGSWIERPGLDRMRALVSGRNILTQMRMAASRTHRSARLDMVVEKLGVKDEVRRGSVGVKVGLIIEQQCDLYVHLSSRSKQWDTCAPEIILTEAGGRMTDLFDQPFRYNSLDIQNRNGIVATNGAAHAKVIDAIAPLLEQFGRKPVEIK
ncbi:MAG TPA: 3'(2'),5'-bisphosphate nucleotidase CysQ [Pyrinomonadaceae bacterium]|nr:3'(2'),5'-bisphosphate nucleotidase CysQ [Pyrinomonadaceae bacterium]